MDQSDIKNDVQHREAAAEKTPNLETTAEDERNYGLVKSRYDELSIPRTLWVFKRVVLVSIAVYTGYVCEGFELSSSGSVIANAGFIKQFGDGKANGVRSLNSTWVGAWSALLNVGQILTFTYIPWFADRFGRKRSFYVAWAWLVVGCILLNTAKSPSVWAVAKLCNGAGVGVLQITCQVYVMEICPNNIRGGMVTFQLVWSNIGSIICSVMMQQLNKKHPDNYLLAMRILWGPIAMMIVCWIFVPESPWFHARRGNKERAIANMKKLYGGVKGYDYEDEYGVIERTIAHEKAMLNDRPRYVDVFRGVNRKRTLTVLLIATAAQFGGLAIVNTYSTYFFSLAGLKDPFLASVIVSCTNLLATILWSFSTDRFGRRLIINSCQTFVCGCLFLVGGLYYTGASTGNVPAGKALLVICCLWSFAFTIVAMAHFLYSAELPSAILRIKSGPVTFLGNSLLGIATTFATPPMLLSLNLRAAFVFGAFTVPTMILMWLYLPETRGRSAAEIDELYERKIPAWRWASTVTSVEEQMHVVVRVKGGVEEGKNE
ncbi:General substrate transporter [Niveomyces insectorum RCEF 264]|uniref:General substrate transporter n=1 Tax=Niveomyces insectorum RCEF 264 TaxID=1081102 RepID=A0A167UX77_9HYPO|nr:General substrate transporter [Niveomyces insectorum RCEF 264]